MKKPTVKLSLGTPWASGCFHFLTDHHVMLCQKDGRLMDRVYQDHES